MLKRPDSTDSNSTTAALQIRTKGETQSSQEQASTDAIILLINDEKKMSYSENSIHSKNKSQKTNQKLPITISSIDKNDVSSKNKLKDYNNQNGDDLNLQTPKEYDSLLSNKNKRDKFLFELEKEAQQNIEDNKFSSHLEEEEEEEEEAYALYNDNSDDNKKQEEIDYEDSIKRMDLDINSPKGANLKMTFGSIQVNQNQRS